MHMHTNTHMHTHTREYTGRMFADSKERRINPLCINRAKSLLQLLAELAGWNKETPNTKVPSWHEIAPKHHGIIALGGFFTRVGGARKRAVT